MRPLRKHHGTGVAVLIDEYDAPVMAGYSAPDGGYYADVVSFLKRWLSGSLKDRGETLELASYLGHGNCMAEAREWYDGYRFGEADVYNPWSALNYLQGDCESDVYWGNTSSNGVVGDLLCHAGQGTLEEIYQHLLSSGTVVEPLDLSVVFPGIGVSREAVWSILFLAAASLLRTAYCPTTRERLVVCAFPTTRSPSSTAQTSWSVSLRLPTAQAGSPPSLGDFLG